MRNHWIIYTDFIADATSPVGTNSNAKGLSSRGFADAFHAYNETANAQMQQFCQFEFLLLDDDGKVYYSGQMRETNMDPLDDFGGPNAGVTQMYYRRLGTTEWQAM